MKKLSLVFFLATAVGIGGQSQVVTILKDSAETVGHRIEQITNTMTLISNTAQELKYALQIVENQARMIRSLGEGDWDGIVDAFEYAARSFDSFERLVEGTEYFKKFDSIAKHLNSENFQNLQKVSSSLSESMRAASDLLWETDYLVDMSKMRFAQSRRISALSKASDSFVTQVQLTNQQLSLVQGEINDLVKLSLAQNSYLAAQANEEDLQDEIADEINEQFFSGKSGYQKKYTKKDYYDAIYGHRYEDIQEGAGE